MSLALPDVTLIMVETQVHDLGRYALVDAMTKVKFGGAVVYTDRPDAFEGLPDVRVIKVQDWPRKIAAESFYYMESQQAATTSHVLMYQWDAGVRDVNCWTDDFLQYDYIGAPWPGKRAGQWQPKDGYSVGNGGFTLMSMKFCNWIYANRDRVRAQSDMGVSYGARDMAVAAGQPIKWPNEDVAYRFSFEHGSAEQRATPSFGYHDVYTWPVVYDRDEVIRRARMMIDNKYVMLGTRKLELLNANNPWIQATIGLDFINAKAKFGPIQNLRRVSIAASPQHRPAHHTSQAIQFPPRPTPVPGAPHRGVKA